MRMMLTMNMMIMVMVTTMIMAAVMLIVVLKVAVFIDDRERKSCKFVLSLLAFRSNL